MPAAFDFTATSLLIWNSLPKASVIAGQQLTKLLAIDPVSSSSEVVEVEDKPALAQMTSQAADKKMCPLAHPPITTTTRGIHTHPSSMHLDHRRFLLLVLKWYLPGSREEEWRSQVKGRKFASYPMHRLGRIGTHHMPRPTISI